MRNNTELKVLLEALQNSRSFCILYPLTALYISECQEVLQDTEFLNVVLPLRMVKD
jgi:hypothetical protein